MVIADHIKSIAWNQEDIIRSITTLYCPDGFDCDPTYSKGQFYKTIPKPRLRFDIEPETDDCVAADCRHLPLEGESLNTLMFDPPFVAAQPTGEATGIITKRFGYYKNVQTELWGMYHEALKEFYRVLKVGGVLVVKCQDTVDSGKQCLSHVEIINTALMLGFYPKDLFILLARNRLIGDTHGNQQHARKYHSYFIVFIKQQSPVKYGRPTINNSSKT